jgi:hypothetical protein
LCHTDTNVISVDAQGTVKVWHGERNVLVREYTLHMAITACCCASGSGLLILAANQQLYCLQTEMVRPAKTTLGTRPGTPSLQLHKLSLDLATQASMAQLQLDELRAKEQENRILARDRDIEHITATREQAKRTTAPTVQPKAVRRRALKQYTKQLHPTSRMLERVRSKYHQANALETTGMMDQQELALLTQSLSEVSTCILIQTEPRPTVSM